MGRIPYAQGLELQQELAERRRLGEIPDVLLLLEHPAVFTKGRRSDARELGMSEEWYRSRGVEVVETDRGGRVTYHGPGQIVAYPIVDLAALGPDGRPDVHAYVRLLEAAMIAALAGVGVPAQVFDGLTGVWTAGSPPVPVGAIGPQGTAVAARSPELAAADGAAGKVGSIGIHVRHGIATHGVAINVNNSLEPFEWIVPCGMDDVRMTSVARELGAEQDFEAFTTSLGDELAVALGRRPREVDPARLLSPAPA